MKPILLSLSRGAAFFFLTAFASVSASGQTPSGETPSDAYLLQPGDSIDLSVAGVPDLHQRALITLSGNVDLPLVGEMKAAGMPLTQLRAKVVAELPQKVYRQRTQDGREIPHVIMPEEIVLSIAEYKPIYVSGDVVRSGEQAYRAGLTVRQAVSIAGGYDVMRFRMNNPILESADMKAEFLSLWTDYARTRAQIWRLHMELGTPDEESSVLKVPIAPDVARSLLRNEQDQLKTRTADRAKERANLEDAINRISDQLKVLAEKKKKDEEGNAADLSDYEKMRELYQKGATINVRISETRRSSLMSSTQLLQTIVEISNMERQKSEYSRQLERMKSQTQLESLKELQEANVRAEQLSARIQSVSQKLLYTSTLQSQLIDGLGGRPSFKVYRGTREIENAEEATVLAPGDVVEVALKAENFAGVPVR